MADEKKPVTSTEFAREDRGEVQIGSNPTQGVETQRVAGVDDASQQVNVRARRVFHKDGNMQGDMTTPGEEFSTSRQRAAELRANGLVEYANESDGGDKEKQFAERDRLDNELRAAKTTTTPLRNPELKLADAPKNGNKK